MGKPRCNTLCSVFTHFFRAGIRCIGTAVQSFLLVPIRLWEIVLLLPLNSNRDHFTHEPFISKQKAYYCSTTSEKEILRRRSTSCSALCQYCWWMCNTMFTRLAPPSLYSDSRTAVTKAKSVSQSTSWPICMCESRKVQRTRRCELTVKFFFYFTPEL